MKKHLVLITATILISVALNAFTQEGMIYLASALMAGIVIITLRNSGSGMMRLTKWAKANPRKTQIWITLLLVFLLSLGMIVGYDLMQLGYRFSDTTAAIFSLVMVAGFFSVPMFSKKNTITLPFTLIRYRLIYTCILIAAYASAVITGNRVPDKYPNSIVANVLASIDQEIFGPVGSSMDEEQFLMSDAGSATTQTEAVVLAAFPSSKLNESPSSEPTLSKKEPKGKFKELRKTLKLEKKQKRMMKRVEKWRKAFAAGGSGGSVVVIILLVLLACTGVCLIVGGFSGGGAWAVILGVVVTFLAVYGIVKTSKKRRENREKILKEEGKL